MSFPIKQILALTMISAFSCMTYASPYSVSCPKQIEVTETTTTAYPGWRALTIQPHYFLNSVTLYSGKPEEMASLVPDSINRVHAIWHFSPHNHTYITCGYNQTSIQLTQALQDKTRSCTVIFDQKVQGYIPYHIECN